MQVTQHMCMLSACAVFKLVLMVLNDCSYLWRFGKFSFPVIRGWYQQQYTDTESCGYVHGWSNNGFLLQGSLER